MFDKLKILASYLWDVHLESTSSDYNDELHVVLSRGRHQLCTANAIYSFDDLYDNYRRAFQKIRVDELGINKVLILGLGLGSIPYMLEKKFGVDFHYTAVEIDEEVARLAHTYTLQNLRSPMETIIADAHDFIMQNDDTFDLICMDVFVDDVIPQKFHKENYLSALGSALGKDGILLFNRLSRTKADIKHTREFFNHSFSQAFPNAAYLDVKGNWMLTNRSLA